MLSMQASYRPSLTLQCESVQSFFLTTSDWKSHFWAVCMILTLNLTARMSSKLFQSRPSEAGWLGLPWPSHFFRKLLKFGLWILNKFNGTVSFTHSFLSYRVGGAGPADTAITGPMFWLRWCCQPFAFRRETRILPTQICAHTKNFAVRA